MEPRSAPFRTTRWTLVRRAARDDDAGQAALEQLCSIYWPAVYGFLRRSGFDRDTAQDRTQAVFARIVERGDLDSVDPARGRFRSWLKACARNVAVNAVEREGAVRRGGGETVVSLDAVALDGAERRLEPADRETPERTFDRLWALAVLERAWQRLREEQVARGRRELFDAMRPWLESAEGPAPYGELAIRFSVGEGALKVAAHRWRQRLRELLVAEVRETLPVGDDGVAELDELLAALG